VRASRCKREGRQFPARLLTQSGRRGS
jgi:hypothetical protein